MSTAPPIDWRLRLGWGIGSLGAATLINGITFLGLFYFTRILGMPATLAGGLLFAAKLFDIVTDPVMGWISDRTNTRWGRRRPWLLLAAAVSGIAFVMVFSAPPLTGTGLAAWTLAALLLYATGYTLFNIPYLAMPAEMTTDYHERSRLMSVRVIFASLGILAGSALAPALVSLLGEDRAAYAGMGQVLGALITVSMLAAWAGTRRARHTRHAPSTMPPARQWALALGNRPYLVLMLAKLLHMLGVAIATSAFLFLVTLVLQRDTAAAGLLGLASTAGVLASVPGWLVASRRWGKRNAYIAAVLVYLPAALSWLLATPAEGQLLFVLRGLAIGVATGGLTLTAQAMLPDTIDHDAQRSGLRREGSFTAGYSFMEKTAFALGPLILGLMLDAAGFVPGGDARPTPAALRAIVLAAAVLPAAASGLSALCLWAFYDLDARLRATPAP